MCLLELADTLQMHGPRLEATAQQVMRNGRILTATGSRLHPRLPPAERLPRRLRLLLLVRRLCRHLEGPPVI